MKKRDLRDFKRARNHFIRAVTEGIIGTGFAIKGARNLLKEREGRGLVSAFTGRFMRRGFGFIMRLAESLERMEKGKPGASKKRKRKIKVE
ncbi:MAG TPA: hypothetical protein VNK81_03495 [Thermodesulfobacteriota bacterium]|nr:hypothetical protein [Thermodesulfobacteriota bacterium]